MNIWIFLGYFGIGAYWTFLFWFLEMLHVAAVAVRWIGSCGVSNAETGTFGLIS